MNIEVNDQHSLNAKLLHGCLRRDCNVVENTEALPSIAEGMMRAACTRADTISAMNLPRAPREGLRLSDASR